MFMMGDTFALILGVSVAIGKEIYDYCLPKKHTCDFWDAFWTIAGSTFGMVVLKLWLN
jgi:hypothetical protein